MPESKKRPDNAITIRSYAKLERYADSFAKGSFNLLILIGAPGLAKSQTVKKAVGDQALWVEGSATAFGIYKALYANQGKPVVIDDVDQFYTDKDAIRLLKCICQTDETKRVSWFTGATGPDKEVPSQFDTTSKVIIIANEWKTLTDNVKAVENRGHLLSFEPSPAEVHSKVAEWFWDQEIHDYFGGHLHLMPRLSMRHYVQASELKDAGMEWLDILQREGFHEKTVQVAKLLADDKYATEESRIEAFKQLGGGGRSTYFNHKKQLGTQRQIDIPQVKLRNRKKSSASPRLRLVSG